MTNRRTFISLVLILCTSAFCGAAEIKPATTKARAKDRGVAPVPVIPAPDWDVTPATTQAPAIPISSTPVGAVTPVSSVTQVSGLNPAPTTPAAMQVTIPSVTTPPTPTVTTSVGPVSGLNPVQAPVKTPTPAPTVTTTPTPTTSVVVQKEIVPDPAVSKSDTTPVKQSEPVIDVVPVKQPVVAIPEPVAVKKETTPAPTPSGPSTPYMPTPTSGPAPAGYAPSQTPPSTIPAPTPSGPTGPLPLGASAPTTGSMSVGPGASQTPSSTSSATTPTGPLPLGAATPTVGPAGPGASQTPSQMGPTSVPALAPTKPSGASKAEDKSAPIMVPKMPSIEKEEKAKILSLPVDVLSAGVIPTSTLLEGEDDIEDVEQEAEMVRIQARGKDPYIVIKKNEKLSTFIEKVATKRAFNVVLPQGVEIIKESVNFPKNKRMLLSEAERYLNMFLGLAGYSLRPAGPYYIVTKLNEVNVARGPLNLYVDVDPKELPEAEDIRAIYFLSNFKIPENTQGNEPINVIIRELMGTQTGYLFDQKSNAIILVGASQKIAYTMNTVLSLDKIGSAEKLAVIPLFNATSKVVADLLNAQILATTQGTPRASRPNIKTSEDLYFAPNTRVIADLRTNSIIVVGQETAISRIRDLVRDYLDQPQDSGRSVLHVYDLQYLNSREFAPILQKIVDSSGGSGQSKKEQGGTDRAFDDVIVAAEEEVAAETKSSGGTGGAQGRLTIGGNRLIIAANNEDWRQIKSLIEQLDKPQLQVIFEVLVIDLSYSALKALRAQTRNPVAMGLGQGVQFQSAQIEGVFTPPAPGAVTPPLALLDSDLLQMTGAPASSMAKRASSGLEAGSMIISLRDPARDNIWSVIKLLDKWSEQKIVSQLFIVAKNNTEATSSSTESRRDIGEASSGASGVTTLPVKNFDAIVKVVITPRISSVDRLTLQTRVTLEDFVSTTDFTRSKRAVETSATLSSGQILVVGGLERVADSQDDTGTPFLSWIPIIGNLFKGSGYQKDRGNLAIFIHPTVVDPKLRSGINKYTADKITAGREAIESAELFSGLKDPITRIFYGTKQDNTPIALFDNYYQRGQEHAKRESREGASYSDTQGGMNDLKSLFANEQNPFTSRV